MRDRETDSWWSIVKGIAIGGELENVPLKEMPAGEKVRWGDWKKRYPNTKVLSIDGKEHNPHSPYDDYFESTLGFRGIQADDKRLPDKEPIFAFRLDGVAYVVPHSRIEGGVTFQIAQNEVFLFREPEASVFSSTRAYVVPFDRSAEGPGRFQRKNGGWMDAGSNSVFSPGEGFLKRGEGIEPEPHPAKMPPPERLTGFDTYWYIWAMSIEDIILLK